MFLTRREAVPPVWARMSHFLLAAALLFAGPSLNAATNAAAPVWLTQPMSMADALGIALRQNSAILHGQSDLESAHGIIVQTRAIALPKLQGSSGYDHNEAVEQYPFVTPGREVVTPKNEWFGDIRVVQSIYQGGRIRSALRSARLTQEQSLLRYQAVVADTLLEVRTTYYGVLLAEQQILVQEAAVKSLSLGLDNTTQRFNTGLVPRFDVLRAEVELANVRPRLIQATNTYRISKFALANTLGYNIPEDVWEDLPIRLTEKLDASPYQVELPVAVAQAIARRPELGAFRKAEGLRKEGIVAAKAGYKPSVGVFGGYNAHNSRYFDDIMHDIAGGMAGVELTWNIFDGNMTRGRVIEAKAQHESSMVDLADGIRRVQLEVRTAHSTFLQARAVLESQQKVQEQAEEALRLSESRYDAGTGTQLDVLNAQTALTQARTTQVQALHDYAVARARLERAMGHDVPLDEPAAKGK